MFAFNHASWRPLPRTNGPPSAPSRHERPLDTYAYDADDYSDADEPMTEGSEQWETEAFEDSSFEEPMPRQAQGSTREFCNRFSRALSLQEAHAEQIAAMRLAARTRQLELATATNTRAPTRARPLSINCETQKKLTQRRMRQRRQRANDERKIARVQQRLAEIERSSTLMDSRTLLWNTNQTARCVGVCREYFTMFSHGYDSSQALVVPQYARAGEFLHAVSTADLLCREYRGVDKLLNQWEIYTRFHNDILVTVDSVQRVDDDQGVVSVWMRANMDLEVSNDTLRTLYPEFYARAQLHPRSREIADSLVGKRYVFPCDKVFHFDRHGKMFAHETKVHIASALLDFLRDPFATVQVLDGSAKTIDGHWKTSSVDYIRQDEGDMYTLPKFLL